MAHPSDPGTRQWLTCLLRLVPLLPSSSGPPLPPASALAQALLSPACLGTLATRVRRRGSLVTVSSRYTGLPWTGPFLPPLALQSSLLTTGAGGRTSCKGLRQRTIVGRSCYLSLGRLFRLILRLRLFMAVGEGEGSLCTYHTAQLVCTSQPCPSYHQSCSNAVIDTVHSIAEPVGCLYPCILLTYLQWSLLSLLLDLGQGAQVGVKRSTSLVSTTQATFALYCATFFPSPSLWSGALERRKALLTNTPSRRLFSIWTNAGCQHLL